MLDPLKQSELHVHMGGCLHVQDLIDIARDFYREIDWSDYCQNYEQVFGQPADPVAWFEQAVEHNNIQPLRDAFVVTDADSGDFARFQARFNLLICVARHLRQVTGSQQKLLDLIFTRHRKQGLRYIEYRAMTGVADTYELFKSFHHEYASACQQASDEQMQICYIASLPRNNALETYGWLCRLLDEQPALRDTLVGIDFCFWEEGLPPKSLNLFFKKLHVINALDPDHALDVVYHVGESFFDKSLESAIRWCHEAAMLGAKRLGHAIALGMPPEVAIGRRENAHVSESVCERLDQIAYDLHHAMGLRDAGVHVDETALQVERKQLKSLSADELVERIYTEHRLEQNRRRQNYVLAQLVQMGTVIETCPTSNLRIGGVPTPAGHPVHRFLASDVNLLIAADDPGIFDVSLANEVDWILEHCDLNESQLAKRLGDPKRFALRFVE